MADRALVLSADHYTIPDSKTGEINELFQVWYVNDYREVSDREFGAKPIKMLVEESVFHQFKALKSSEELPSIFDLDLKSRPGKANAAALTIVGFKFVSKPDLFPSDSAIKKAA